MPIAHDPPLTPAKLKAARALLGITQEDLAAKSKVAPATVNGYETGRYKPHRATIHTIVTFLREAGIVITERGVERKK